MHYEIEASIYSTKHQLDIVQRTSPFFTDCPVIGAHALRDRSPLKLDAKEMERFEKDIKRLYGAHAIEIFEVEEYTHPDSKKKMSRRINVRDLEAQAKAEGKKQLEKDKELVKEAIKESQTIGETVPSGRIMEKLTEPVTDPDVLAAVKVGSDAIIEELSKPADSRQFVKEVEPQAAPEAPAPAAEVADIPVPTPEPKKGKKSRKE